MADRDNLSELNRTSDRDVGVAREADLDRDRKVTDPDRADANRDPISGAPGSHPIGTGVGAAAAGAAGTWAGAAIGAAISGPAAPIGGVIGAVVGAIAGGLAGKGVAEAVDPTAEDAYWREHHKTRPYVESGHNYDRDLQPAYRYGWENRERHTGKTFDEAESHLAQGWDKAKGESSLAWDKAKGATRDAWDRLGSGSGDSHRSTPPSAASSSAAASGAQSHGGVIVVDHTTPTSHNAVSSGTGTGASDFTYNPNFSDDRHWRDNYQSRPYFQSGMSYDDYEPAYRYANEYRGRYPGRNFDDVESEMGGGWDRFKGNSRLTWEKAKHATRDAWHGVERTIPGDADRDGR